MAAADASSTTPAPTTGSAATPASQGVVVVGPITDGGLDLAIPAAELDAAQARGAMWDEPRRRWCVPAGRRVNVFAFRRWLWGDVVVDEGPTTRGVLIAYPQRCWSCGTATRVIAGALVLPGLSLDPDGLVPFDDLAEYLAEVLELPQPNPLGIGPLLWRRSRAVPKGYVANTCQGCLSIQGNWHVAEGLREYLAEGADYGRLQVGVQVPIPVALLELAMRF
jgi:hypothetical protein